MVKKLLSLGIALFLFQITFSQSGGWFQYGSPTNINQIVTKSNGDVLAGTDFGFVHFNATLDISSYRNLTSQSIPMGEVEAVAVNPNDEDEVAVFENERLTIMNIGGGTIVHSFNATVDIEPVSNPHLYWGNSGDIYLYDPDVTIIQTVSGGTVNPTQDLGFRPQAIVENNAGSTIYYATWNTGFWEYDKNTTTWTQYTEANSNLLDDAILSLYVDTNDLLYIGGFQGLNTLDTVGTMNSYQEQIPSSVFYFPVYQIDVHPSNGTVLVRSSEPSVAYAGFCTVDLSTNTWTNYTNDGGNCINENVFTHTMYNNDGSRIIACASDFSSGDANNTFLFDPDNPSSSCSQVDFNYLNASPMSTAGWNRIGVRTSDTSGSFDIGFTNSSGFNIINIPTSGFDGIFPVPANITPGAGQYFYDVLTAGDNFLVTDNLLNINFVDQSNSVSQHNLGISGFSMNVTKRADIVVDGSTCSLVFNGFEASNRTVYTTECDLATNTCDTPLQLFTNNRDLTTNVLFHPTEASTPGNIKVAALKTNGSGNPAVEILEVLSNGTVQPLSDDDVSSLISGTTREPRFFETDDDDDFDVAFYNDDADAESFFVRTEVTNNPVFTEYNFDFNDDDDFDPEIIVPTGREFPSDASSNTQSSFENCVTVLSPCSFTDSGSANYFVRTHFSQGDAFSDNPSSRATNEAINYREIPESEFNDLPGNLSVYSVKTLPYSSTHYATVLYTNYGLLIKPSIDYSSLSLSTNDLEDNKVIRLYPNPSNNNINFSSNQITKIEVFDLNGKKVLSKKGSSVSIESLSVGIYMVKGSNDKGDYVIKKLIKE